jgi:DNA-binding MarR family transcriptional regulator
MPKPGTYSRKSLSSKEWHKELLLFWIFQTCFKLQASLDRRFLNFGMTFQEAVVLMRCVEAGEIAPGRLALILARDKGKITRFVDRLEAAELVKRSVNPGDRRYSVIKATPKGKRLAERIASTFEVVRTELFVSVLDCDIERLSKVLPQLHRNALRIGTKRSVSEGRQKRRIGVGKNALQEETCLPATPSSGVKSVGDGRSLVSQGEHGINA